MAENWIIPCNIKVFDLPKHFLSQKNVVWRNSFTIHKGDTAYIYIGGPIGEIRYKCSVISDDVDDSLLKKNAYAIPKRKYNNFFSKKDKYIVLELICEYPRGTFTLTHLREQGLGQVQIQARTNRQLQAYIDKTESKILNGGDTND